MAVQTHHFRCGEDRPAITLHFEPTGNDDILAYGVAVCSVSDQGCYAKGKMIAEGRAKARAARRIHEVPYHAGALRVDVAKRLVEMLRVVEERGEWLQPKRLPSRVSHWLWARDFRATFLATLRAAAMNRAQTEAS